MTDRERLIERILNTPEKNYPVVGSNLNCITYRIAEMIADHILSDGWIRQPCKVGDKMYCDGKYFASHCAGEIMEFPVNSVKTSVRNIFRGEIDVQFDFDDFGKTVFLTREEAEKALAEREGKEP